MEILGSKHGTRWVPEDRRDAAQCEGSCKLCTAAGDFLSSSRELVDGSHNVLQIALS
jgi:hypothetical protein